MSRSLTAVIAVLGIVYRFGHAGAGELDHSKFTGLLEQYVDGDRVNYAALCTDDRLLEYTEHLAGIDPDGLDDTEQLAFWINAYNAFTLKLICDNYPVKSINDLHTGGRLVGHALRKTAWDRDFININGEVLNLNNIEHDIIRKAFDDPRIHFALVCAAKSCPPLRAEAFEADRLDDQLEEQGRLFFSQPDKNRVDVGAKTIYLSKILDWYADDFGGNEKDVVAFILRYLPEDVAAAVKANPDAWSVKYTDYDWALNE